MTKIEAIKGSIKKWEDIVCGVGEDEGMRNCSLCKEYIYNSPPCLKCPIREHTKTQACHKSPYKEWNEHMTIEHNNKIILRVYCPTCKKLAQKELDFLKMNLKKNTVRKQNKIK